MVYVDDINLPFKGKSYCHMVADTEEELDQMADKIGLKREWKQTKGIQVHYDVSPSMKVKAIKNGAVEMGFMKLARLMRDRRKHAG